MDYKINKHRNFEKQYAKYASSGNKGIIKKIDTTIQNLLNKTFTNSMNPHPLHGEFEGYYDCHADYDVVIIYKYDNENQVLFLKDIGSHRNFGMHEALDDFTDIERDYILQYV